MAIGIRQATIADAPHIADVFKSAFEEDVSLAQIELCFEQKNHQTWVAEIDKKVVGFTDSFITTALDGTKRLELDLLAVHPDYHRQGIGKLLINQVVNSKNEVDMVRALVAGNNDPMHKVIGKLGFTLHPETQALYIASHTANKASKPENAHLVPVSTFAYSGIWLEEEITAQAIHAALSAKQAREIVGAVVSTSDETAIQALKAANFDFIKHFRWWQY